jgi:ATP-dependent Zn protease
MAVQSATIVPHGNTLGNVMLRPDDDLVSSTKKQLQAAIDVAFGGFVAEELHSRSLDDVTLGAASDIANANQLARELIKGGFGKNTRFLQPSPNGASESVKEATERDVQEILDDSKRRVTALIQREKAAWTTIAKALLEKESLTREEIYALWDANRTSSGGSGLLKARAKPA